ncbi:MAG: DUF4058 family protein [Gemmataceae bacterium]
MGQTFEIDVATYDDNPISGQPAGETGNGGGRTATVLAPTLTLETDLPEQDEFEVQIYDTERGGQLVAAIELVSPSNKDRPENRRAFVAKVAALLQNDVCVSIVDLVTVRQANLYAELLELIGRSDPKLGAPPPHLYALTLRTRKPLHKRPMLDVWFYPMALGQPLPTLPLWLSADLHVLLPLEAGYEETCRLLRIQ